MKYLLLTLFCLLLISASPLASAYLSNTPWIPPTNANRRIATSNGTVQEMNYSGNYNFVGTGSASVTSSNNSKTVYFNVPSPSVNNHQGTYNQTLANNVVKNTGGQRINFINGTNNPITLTNDPTRSQINVTISSSGGVTGVSSLNALTGALTIAGVAGNTTVTTSGGNTITINTAYNIVTTQGSAQTITKGLTINALTLGGNAVGNNKNFTGINNMNATKFFQNGTRVIDTLVQGSGISITGSGNSRTITNTGLLSAITSINSQTGPGVNIVCQTGNTTCTNSTNQVKIGLGVNPVITGGSDQPITKSTFTINNLKLGGQANVQTNSLLVNTHTQSFPQGNSGTFCLTNQTSTCGTGTGTIIGSQNVGKGTGSFGVLSSPTSTTIKGKNMTAGTGISLSGNTTDITISTTDPHTAILSSQNVGKGTGSVGVLSSPSSTVIKGRNMTGSSPITITKTNDTDISIACSTCLTGTKVDSITGTAHNVTASSSTGAVTLNTGDNVVVTNGATQNFTKLVIHNAGLTMSHSDISIGGNKLKTTNLNIFEQASPTVTTTIEVGSTSGGAGMFFVPSGDGQGSGFELFRTHDFQTNYEELRLANDQLGTEFDLLSFKGGTGTNRPIVIGIQTTKYESFDVASSITSYVKNIWTPISDPVTAFTNAIWKSSTTADVIKYRNAGNTTTYSIVSTLSVINSTTGQLSGNGTGTSSLSKVMDGVYATITPKNTGRITVSVSGDASDGTLSDGCNIEIRQSTSNMGANGAALAGTILGNSIRTNSQVAAAPNAWSRTFDFSGPVGTKQFFDLGFSAVTGGTCTITSVNWNLVEH